VTEGKEGVIRKGGRPLGGRISFQRGGKGAVHDDTIERGKKCSADILDCHLPRGEHSNYEDWGRREGEKKGMTSSQRKQKTKKSRESRLLLMARSEERHFRRGRSD